MSDKEGGWYTKAEREYLMERHRLLAEDVLRKKNYKESKKQKDDERR